MSGGPPNIYRDTIKNVLDALPISRNAWAKRAGLDEGTLRSFLSGKTASMRQQTFDSLMQAAREFAEERSLPFPISDDNQGAPRRTVWVKGLVGAGAAVQVLDGMGDDEGLYEVSLPPDMPNDKQYVAFEIRGFSMPPAQERWIIYCLDREAMDPTEALGKPCVVELADGRMLFKTVRRGYTPGRYNLDSWDGSPPIEDVEIVRAQPFVFSSDPAFVRL